MTTGAWTKLPGSRWKYGLTPDWTYFQCASMTDQFFEVRVEEFLQDFNWTQEDKNKMMLVLLKRYNELKNVPDEDFQQLQNLGATCYGYATKWLDKLENFNQKELVLSYIETIRRFLVEWIK